MKLIKHLKGFFANFEKILRQTSKKTQQYARGQDNGHALNKTPTIVDFDKTQVWRPISFSDISGNTKQGLRIS